MAQHIEILDLATANRISAGEVVERPASIAKELIENSLDAGASAVTVEIREGGIDYLRVTDNGAGFPSDQVRIAFERHATSKLRSGDTLESIGTLGFRGEALPSIAAVAKVELTSRQRAQEGGVRLTIQGGQFGDLRAAGCPEGTTMVVRELFYNTPARRAFLKRPATEGGYVGDAVLQLALARPDVAFRMVSNGKTIFHTPGDGDLLKTIQVLFGRAIAPDLLPIRGEWAGGTLTGYVGLQDAARANRQREYFIINGRFVRSPLLALAMEEAVKGRIAIGKYPFCVLRLQIPLNTVDVNVHPNKLEVRFRDEPGVRVALMEIIAECLRPARVEARVSLLPPQDDHPESIAPSSEARVEVVEPQLPKMSPPGMPQADQYQAGVAREAGILAPPAIAWQSTPAQAPIVGQAAEAKHTIETTQVAVRRIEPMEEKYGKAPSPSKPVEWALDREGRMIGVLFATYLMVEYGDELLMIDQHAAHERLLYEELITALDIGAASQSLLVPYSFDVTPREKERVMENMAHMEALGFMIEEFGPSSLRALAMPHILGEAQLGDFFVELMDSMDGISAMRSSELKRDAIARIACHKAVKAGDRLSQSELKTLLSMVMREDTPLTCPHGRPILLRMTRAQLEKRFRRTQ